MTGIIIAACAVGVTGLLLGLFLGFMGKKFAVEVDQKEIDVRAELPGNNCGGCGYAGCDALAKAIAAGEADCGACPVGGAPVAAKIAAIMGAEAGSQERMTAFVKCGGDCDKAKNNYVYSGVQDCTIPASASGIFSGIILGLARAFGEALAVAMVIGQTTALPDSIFSTTKSLTTEITAQMGNAMEGGETKTALWTLALLLFLISLLFIFLIHFLSAKQSEESGNKKKGAKTN